MPFTPKTGSTAMVEYEDLEGCDVHLSKETFGSEVAHFIGLKGFCVVGTGIQKTVLQQAQTEARELDDYERFYAPPTLVVEGLLGHEGSPAIAELEPFVMEAKDRKDGENLQIVDNSFTEVAAKLDEFLDPYFGFVCGERTVGLLHQCGKVVDEPAELTERKAAKWLHIFRRHRLMLVTCLGAKGGLLTLRPFDEDSVDLSVPMKFGQMVVLRADHLSHTYTPSSDKDLTMTCWILQQDRLGPRGAFADGRDGMPLVPAAMNLTEWANTRLMMIKSAVDAGSLADQDIPRAWKLAAAHNVHTGVQCAVRGVAINAPGRNESMGALCASLTGAMDFGIEVPFKRWDHFREGNNMQGWYNPEPDIWRQTRFRTNIKHGTFIEGQDFFDNKFFNMSVLESKVTDPCQRLALESAYESLHFSGYTKKALMQAFIGVYQGHTASDWDKIEHDTAGGCAGSYSPTIASNRVSFALGIMGPSFTIDVEGAASLAAIYQGAHDIIPSGDWRKPPTTASVCGGVTVMLSTYWWPVHNQFMSIGGRSLTFDQSASGYIKGEGVNTVVLKRHGEIVEGKVVIDDSHSDLSIIAGWAMINSGANAGLTAPSGPSMQKVVADSARVARISPLDVDAIETHGSGQYIHDATEVSCLAKSLRHLPGGDEEVLCVNSSKSKLGFCQESSGIAAFFGTIVSQRIGIVSPNIHVKTLNPYITLEDYAVHISNEALSFRTPSSFHGVTAYGFGGTNVHTLLHTDLDTERFPTGKVDLDRTVFSFWPGGGGELEDELKPDKGYMIMGSWSSWDASEKMRAESDGSYSFLLTLGPNRFEHFVILIDGDSAKALHPGTKDGAGAAPVQGPDRQEDIQGSCWCVDGRTQLVAMPALPGPLKFSAHGGAIATGGDILEKEMTLEEAKEECQRLPACKGFCYFGAPDAEGKVNVVFKNKFELVEKTGWSSFQVEEATEEERGALEYFKVSSRDVGLPGDQYKIKLQLAGKWKTVIWDKLPSETSSSTPEDSGDYYLSASWNDWALEKMAKSSSQAGLYAVDVTLPGSRFARFMRGEFQIIRNKDYCQTFSAGDNLSAVGKSDSVSGPDEGNINWQIEAEPGETFRIEFQRTVDRDDDLKKVTWTKVEKLADR
mmetsp:Transcript_16580/g.45018  ORF Transcript_16580/g.45018 Transcript_16580/m.45018 type:complete len:1127 (-) Transcript_16580:43-3423(-)